MTKLPYVPRPDDGSMTEWVVICFRTCFAQLASSWSVTVLMVPSRRDDDGPLVEHTGNRPGMVGNGAPLHGKVGRYFPVF